MTKLNDCGIKLPKLCNDRGRCHVWVRENGKLKRKTMGKAGSEANRNYRKFINDLTKEPSLSLSMSQPDIGIGSGNVVIAKLCAEFLKRERRASETQQDNERRIVAVLVSLYGDLTTDLFDINCLRVVRNEFIQKRYVRQKINWRVRIIQFIFKWGASYKIVPTRVYEELKTLIPIQKGEYGLPESKERQTVTLADMEKSRVEMSPVIRGMVDVHLAVAGRPTAICEMRIENIDRQAEDLWAITVKDKMDYLEDAEPRILYLAKPEIDVLLPLIGERTEGYIFRPIDAIAYDKERRAKGAVYRKKTPSRVARDEERASNPKREIGECYNFTAYRTAIYRACDRAGVKRWFPYQLRHTGITRIGLEHGVEAAQHSAGHKDIKTTLKYFHGEDEIAKRVALSRNKPAIVKSTSPAMKEQSQDVVIAELLQQNKQLLEILVQKGG